MIGDRAVGPGHPTYFIADIGANHDGDLERAKHLIQLAAEAGADAAKFQNFTPDTIVSDRGFRSLGAQASHQASWSKSVFEVYADASLDTGWTPELKATCDEAGVEYFTSPYSPSLVDAVDPFVRAHKIGSGDITWLEIVDHIARKGKPVLLAAGASELQDVERAVERVLAVNEQLLLMQCNTNYTGSLENFRFVNLRVLRTFAERFPGIPLGLSDHTPGHATVLGAVALGACAVEKHFTDDRGRVGPDHAFSMAPHEWREMVDRTRELEAALGDGVKRVEGNERETVVLQRRAVCAARVLKGGTTLTRDDVQPLRPCPTDAIGAAEIERIPGRVLVHDIEKGEALRWSDLA
jgi:N-acetylneuraminate synthase